MTTLGLNACTTLITLLTWQTKTLPLSGFYVIVDNTTDLNILNNQCNTSICHALPSINLHVSIKLFSKMSQNIKVNTCTVLHVSICK